MNQCENSSTVWKFRNFTGVVQNFREHGFQKCLNSCFENEMILDQRGFFKIILLMIKCRLLMGLHFWKMIIDKSFSVRQDLFPKIHHFWTWIIHFIFHYCQRLQLILVGWSLKILEVKSFLAHFCAKYFKIAIYQRGFISTAI